LAAGSTLAIGLAAPVGATTPAPVPQFLIRFEAISTRSPDPTVGLQFRSTACVISSATHPIAFNCQETGHVVLDNAGGLGTASLSSVVAGIKWNFTLRRAVATGATTYLMNGTGTESLGTPPALHPVHVTGRITVLPTPDPTVGPLIKGTEAVYPLP
jgi:hypothetical protein